MSSTQRPRLLSYCEPLYIFLEFSTVSKIWVEEQEGRIIKEIVMGQSENTYITYCHIPVVKDHLETSADKVSWGIWSRCCSKENGNRTDE